MNLIEIENITFHYNKKEIIKGISFGISAGEYISVIGPNGAGKSTLLKLLCGILFPCCGIISIDGINIRETDRKELAKKITYVSQSAVSSEHTVQDFIMFSRYPYFSSFSAVSDKDRKKVAESMDITSTAEFANRKLKNLSGGERQRVNIASAIAQDTDIILFDEPGTFLDPYFNEQITSIISDINNDLGKTVINITHNINKALRYSNRIAALKNGNLEFIENAYNISTEKISELYDTSFIDLQHPDTKQRLIIKK